MAMAALLAAVASSPPPSAAGHDRIHGHIVCVDRNSSPARGSMDQSEMNIYVIVLHEAKGKSRRASPWSQASCNTWGCLYSFLEKFA